MVFIPISCIFHTYSNTAHKSMALESFWIWLSRWSPFFTAFLYSLFLSSVGSVSIIPATLSILHGSLRALMSSDSSRSMKSRETPNSLAMDSSLTVLYDSRNWEQMITLVSRMKQRVWWWRQGSFLTRSIIRTNTWKKLRQRQQQNDSRQSLMSGSFIKQTMAYEESRIFFLMLTRSMFRMPVRTLQVTSFSQLMTSGQLKVGSTSTKSLLAAVKSRTIRRQMPSQTLSLFFLSQSPPFSSNLQHSSMFSLILWLFSKRRQMPMSLKAMSIFLPISMVRLRARLYVSMASGYFPWSLQSSALASTASRTSVSPKFSSASLILASFSSKSCSKVFSMSMIQIIFKLSSYQPHSYNKAVLSAPAFHISIMATIFFHRHRMVKVEHSLLEEIEQGRVVYVR